MSKGPRRMGIGKNVTRLSEIYKKNTARRPELFKISELLRIGEEGAEKDPPRASILLVLPAAPINPWFVWERLNSPTSIFS